MRQCLKMTLIDNILNKLELNGGGVGVAKGSKVSALSAKVHELVLDDFAMQGSSASECLALHDELWNLTMRNMAHIPRLISETGDEK